MNLRISFRSTSCIEYVIVEFFSETVFLLMISSEFSWYYGDYSVATLLHKRVSQIDKDKVTR